MQIHQIRHSKQTLHTSSYSKTTVHKLGLVVCLKI